MFVAVVFIGYTRASKLRRTVKSFFSTCLFAITIFVYLLRRHSHVFLSRLASLLPKALCEAAKVVLYGSFQ